MVTLGNDVLWTFLSRTPGVSKYRGGSQNGQILGEEAYYYRRLLSDSEYFNRLLGGWQNIDCETSVSIINITFNQDGTGTVGSEFNDVSFVWEIRNGLFVINLLEDPSEEFEYNIVFESENEMYIEYVDEIDGQLYIDCFVRN